MPIIDEAVAAADKIKGWMNVVELRWLAQAAQGRKYVAEIGSWQGRSAKAMAMTVGQTLLCCDPLYSDERIEDHNTFKKFNENLAPEIASGKARLVRKLSVDAAADVEAILRGEKLGMVFIDGGHLFEDVSSDIARWKPMLEAGGILCGHDYGNEKDWPEVTRAVDAAFGSGGVSVAPGTCIWVRR